MKEIKLEDLLKNYKSLYADTWEETFEIFDNNEIHKRIVNNISEDIKNGEIIFEPITIFNKEDGDNYCFPSVTNGHHRIYASFRSGLNSIPYINFKDEPKIKRFAISLLKCKKSDCNIIFDYIVDKIHKLKINNVWLESYTFGFEEGLEISWQFSYKEEFNLTLNSLNNEIFKIIQKLISEIEFTLETKYYKNISFDDFFDLEDSQVEELDFYSSKILKNVIEK